MHSAWGGQRCYDVVEQGSTAYEQKLADGRYAELNADLGTTGITDYYSGRDIFISWMLNPLSDIVQYNGRPFGPNVAHFCEDMIQKAAIDGAYQAFVWWMRTQVCECNWRLKREWREEGRNRVLEWFSFCAECRRLPDSHLIRCIPIIRVKS